MVSVGEEQFVQGGKGEVDGARKGAARRKGQRLEAWSKARRRGRL